MAFGRRVFSMSLQSRRFMFIGCILFLVCLLTVLPGLKKTTPQRSRLYQPPEENYPDYEDVLGKAGMKAESFASPVKSSNIGQPDTYINLFNNISEKEKSTRRKSKPNYKKLRRTYQVPDIETPTQVNCAAMLEGDERELKKAKRIVHDVWKVPIYEETYEQWFQDCEAFKTKRGYVQIPLTKEEEEFPLAFSIAMFQDVEATERLLRAIYQPQNIYCIHIDTKTPLLIHRTVYGLANCFDNVFVASHLDKIKWGDISVVLPDINCMRDFVRYHRGKWKYYINLTGQEMVLRTNWELVQIAKIFNGSNDIAGSKPNMDMDRVKYLWTHRWSYRYQQTIFFNTYQPKEPNPWNLTFFKGELHALFSQRMVEYLVESEIGKGYLQWCWDTGHPSEHYWNTLNYNKHAKAPGGYEGPLDIAHQYAPNLVSRAKHWPNMNYGDRKCDGKVTRGICVYGVNDLPWLHKRKELVANKFYLTYEYLAYDCLEERHRNRTKMGSKVPFDIDHYKNLPTVLYSRKDGLYRS